MAGRRLGAWLVLCCCLLVGGAACSRAPEPEPQGLAGLTLGDAPGSDLTPLPAVLPGELAGVLAYFTRADRVEPFHGVALTDPVCAFYRNRLFSIAAALVDPTEAPRLRRELETGYGAPLCREAAGGVSCLWRLDTVEMVLEQGGEERGARFMLRSPRLAEDLLRWRGQAVPLEPGGPGD